MKIVSALIILLALLMEKAAISKYVALFTLAVFCSSGSIYCIKYNTGAGIVNDKLNVHLVAHSHDDVGWLKTVDQYFVGSNNSIQGACVENVLDSVVEALQRDPTRKFVFAEQAFFQRWWAIQDMETQAEVRKLVDAGQLEFVNGGWVMHDEAASHYIDMIDQTTLGHCFIKEQFNKTPRAGWQIDPFGHSAVQAYLLGAELGFDSVHFARIDYQDRLARKGHKSLETIWRGSKTFGCSSQIFSNVFPVHYSAPGPFHFEVNDERSIPVQDNPLRYDYNVAERVNDFVHASIIQANVTRANHIMWTMGDDFQYQYAESWFKQMDKLIHYVNKDGRVNALYSTPSIYTDAKNVADETWPLKVDDYFPYADGENAYWTGYFTSRPAFKRYVRTLSGYYLAARQLEYLSGRRIAGPNTFSLGDALGVAQHHDAITGTAKQHTTNDYIKRLAAGASEAEAITSSALACLLEGKPITQCNASTITFDQCQLLNISYCPSTEQDIPKGKSLVMVAYNPLGWNRTDVIRIPVDNANLIVQDSSGSVVEAQYLDMDNVTVNLRNFYTKAYLGILPEKVPKFWLCFGVSVPPLGWNTYFISERNGKGIKRSNVSVMDKVHNQIVEIGPGNLKMSYSASGQYHKMFNSEIGVDLPLQQSFLQYESSIGEGDGQASGAYIFRPSGDPSIINRTGSMVVVRGGLVEEIHQQFDSWIYQVTRLYRDKEHAEVEFTIGPIPVMYSGKEVITKMKTNMATNTEFYTDSNGRDFMKRIRNYRKDWNLSVHQPVAGNYYPINLGIYVNDSTYELSVLVDRATGGASIKDGEIELMLHRRLLADDGKGVQEALDEQVCVEGKCDGLTIRGRYYMSIHKLGGGAQWRRTTGQEVYSPLLLAFTHENSEKWKASRSTKATFMDSNYSFPLNVALITLQELEDKSVLLRLAHLYEAGEDAEYSRMAIIELKKMFSGKESVSEKSRGELAGVGVAGEISPEELKSDENKRVAMERSCGAYWTTLAPNVEEYSGTAAKFIATGSGHLIKGILWCGDVTVDRLKWGHEVLKKRLDPCEKKEIDKNTMKRIKRVKRMTKMTKQVATGVLSGVVRVSGFFTSSVANSKAGKKFFSLLPGEMILASLDGFNRICDAVEVAGKNVMSTTSTVTTGLVTHKYGDEAGKATNEGLGAAGHAIGTAWTVFKIRKALNPKSVLKPTTLAKTAVKEAAREHKAKKSSK